MTRGRRGGPRVRARRPIAGDHRGAAAAADEGAGADGEWPRDHRRSWDATAALDTADVLGPRGARAGGRAAPGGRGARAPRTAPAPWPRARTVAGDDGAAVGYTAAHARYVHAHPEWIFAGGRSGRWLDEAVATEADAIGASMPTHPLGLVGLDQEEITMATTKIPARDFTIEIDTAYPGTPAWTAIGGLNSLTPSPSTNRADTTDFDSNGVAEHLVMKRGLEFTIAGHHLEDALTGDRDPGQAAVETLARAVGLAALGSFRVLTRRQRRQLPRLGRGDHAGGGHNNPRPGRPAHGLGRGDRRLMATSTRSSSTSTPFAPSSRPPACSSGSAAALRAAVVAAGLVALDGIRLARRGANDPADESRARRGPVRHGGARRAVRVHRLTVAELQALISKVMDAYAAEASPPPNRTIRRTQRRTRST